MKKTVFIASTLALAASALTAPARAAEPSPIDAEAAERQIRANGCSRCHAPVKNKEGPSWTQIAQKYQGRADAEDRLVHFLLSRPGEPVLFADGREEPHRSIRPSADADLNDVRNLVAWMLSRQPR
jgi:cytochrome c